MANIIVNAEKLEKFSLISGTRQGCPLLPLLFNVVLEFQARAIREEKEIKESQTARGEVKLSLFVNSMILYTENSKDATRKLLEHINEFSKMAGYTVNKQKSFQFLYTNNEQSKREIKEITLFTIIAKRIKHLRINLPKEAKELYL